MNVGLNKAEKKERAFDKIFGCMAKYKNTDDPRFVIQNCMRNRNTLEFIGLWEALNNPNFNRVQFDTFRNEARLNRFTMTSQKWIDSTNAIGIISKSGRYGGTYAHYDLAMKFILCFPHFRHSSCLIHSVA